jgi:cobalt/nickel transport protein
VSALTRKLFANTLLITALALILVSPFVLSANSEFGGTDGAAEELISEINCSYRPWFGPLWSPPGPETETLLFTLQAVLGSSFIAYYIGFTRGRRGSSGQQQENISSSGSDRSGSGEAGRRK